MSVVPGLAPGPPGHPSTVSVLGHKVSTDALLVAGASLVGIFVLWRMAQPAAGAVQLAPVPATSIDPNALVGTGASFASPPVQSPLSTSPPAAGPMPSQLVNLPVQFNPPAPGQVASNPVHYFAYSDFEQGLAAHQAGVPEFFQAAPGVFEPVDISETHFTKPTPIYSQVP